MHGYHKPTNVYQLCRYVQKFMVVMHHSGAMQQNRHYIIFVNNNYNYKCKMKTRCMLGVLEKEKGAETNLLLLGYT